MNKIEEFLATIHQLQLSKDLATVRGELKKKGRAMRHQVKQFFSDTKHDADPWKEFRKIFKVDDPNQSIEKIVVKISMEVKKLDPQARKDFLGREEELPNQPNQTPKKRKVMSFWKEVEEWTKFVAGKTLDQVLSNE